MQVQRNHPFHVLVSSDDPWHLNADAIVLCDEKIIERQLLRRRGKIPRRLDIRNYSEFDLDSNSRDDLRTAQQMINEGKIDAFIIPRGSYSLAGLNERRHAMLPDAEEMAGMRFVPAPFVDLMLVLSRQGFHPHVIQSWTDNEAKNAWLTTKAILERTRKELHNRIGIHYRQRNVGPILQLSIIHI